MEQINQICERAAKVVTDGKRAAGIGQRVGPVAAASSMDKTKKERLREQEKVLRTALATGEGQYIKEGAYTACRQAVSGSALQKLSICDGLLVNYALAAEGANSCILHLSPSSHIKKLIPSMPS